MEETVGNEADDDYALLLEAGTGDHDALAKLYWRHSATVHRVVRRYATGLPQDELEDLVHDTFVTVFKKAKRYARTGTVRGWICGIGANKAMAAQRKQSTRARLMDGVFTNRRRQVEQRHQARQLRRTTDIRMDVQVALEQLRPEDRRMLLLSVVEELTAVEIAEVLGMPAATVRTRLHRARLALRDYMRETELDASTEGEVRP